MGFSIKDIFFSFFKDSGWVKKFSVGMFFIIVFPIINTAVYEYYLSAKNSGAERIGTTEGTILLIVSLLLKLFASLLILNLLGYAVIYTKNKLNETKRSLPRWDNYVEHGFKSFFISLVCIIILSPVLYIGNIFEVSDDIIICVWVLLSLPLAYFATISYSKNLNFKEAFEFKRIFKKLKYAFLPVFVSAIIVLPYEYYRELYDVIIILPITLLSKLFFIILMGFVDFWLLLVSFNIFIAIYKIAENKSDCINADS